MAAWHEASSALMRKAVIVTATTVRTGRHLARVVLQGDDGRIGTAEFEFAASLHECRGVGLSGVMLGSVTGNQFAPTIRVANEAFGYVEVYGTPPGGQAPVVLFDIDGGLPVKATLSPTREVDRWMAIASLPVSSLALGDHAITATANSAAGKTCKAEGVFRKIS